MRDLLRTAGWTVLALVDPSVLACLEAPLLKALERAHKIEVQNLH